MGTHERATASNEKHMGPPKHLLNAGYKMTTLSELNEAFLQCKTTRSYTSPTLFKLGQYPPAQLSALNL